MREILFRGKDVDTKKWVYGQYIHLHKTTYCCVGSEEQEKENQIHQIVFERTTDWNLPNRHLRADVIAETVGQYTGFTDAFGKKIFEGDLVTCDRGIGSTIDKLVFEIKFDPGAGFFGATDGGSDIEAKSFGLAVVVGNIHDNPELKDGDKQCSD